MQQSLRSLVGFRASPALQWVGVCVTALLTACGGGGGGGSSPLASAIFAPSASLANLCASPRANTADRQGSVEQEKAYLRSFIQETYYWYKDVKDPLASTYATPQTYFDVLKTTAELSPGVPLDRFHFWQYTADWNAASSGSNTNYGIRWAYLADYPPRNWTVSEVAPNSPAALAGVRRGDRLTSIDGVDFVNASSTAAINQLNAGLLSDPGVPHQFGFNASRVLSLAKAQYQAPTVHDVQTFSSGGATVGYFVFDTHIANSEAELVAAIQQLQAAGVSDLVIDLRYNGGGLLSIASELAYMVAGPARTGGKTFERLTFNDKLSADNFSFPFYTVDSSNLPLPSLNLGHVSVLVTGATASASESVINSLRGVNVTVDLIGSTTYGKPYGFVPQDNCGVTYFAVQFKGVNDKGTGDYDSGFVPTCAAADDYTHALGDTAETMLSTALSYRQTHSCPVVASTFAGPVAQVFSGARLDPNAPALYHPVTPALRILPDRPRP